MAVRVAVNSNVSMTVLTALQLAAVGCALMPGGLDRWLPLRMVVAGVAVLWLPGTLWIVVVRGRSRHFLEGIATAALASTTLLAGVGLATLAVGLPIGASVAGVLGVNAVLLLVCLRRRLGLTVRWRTHDLCLAGVLAGLAVVGYRWGDDITAVGWEVSLHVGYVRQYASGLPLTFESAVLRPPDIVAQNYFYLWEFILAVIARVAGVDPMVAALKSRWLIPPLGLAAFFFMVHRLVGSSSLALRATWVMVAAVLTQFLTLPPNAYDVYIQSGPLRQVGAFFGSIHHSDSAMELLLPLLIGTLFWALRSGTAQAWAIFSAMLAVAFLWHPREYFQAMWYGGVAMLVDAVTGLRQPAAWWRRRARAYGTMVGCYLAVALMLYAGLPASIKASPEHGVGLAAQLEELKKFGVSLTDWPSWTAGSWPFGFHLHGYEAPGLAPGPPLVFSWLVLAVPAAAALLAAASRSLRWTGVYLLVLWLVSLCSYKFQQLMQAITYHEILISKPRLVHLFAYAVIGLGVSELVRLIAGRRAGISATARVLAASLTAGLVFWWVWSAGAPAFTGLFRTLNVVFFATAALLVISLSRRDGAVLCPGRGPGGMLPALAFGLFALPASYVAASERWSVMAHHQLAPTSLFGPANPVHLSPDTIAYLQAFHPARTRLLVEPNQPHMVHVYAPVHVMPLLGNIGADNPQLQQGAAGTHPVFNAALRNGSPDAGQMMQFLDEYGIDYVLGTRAYVAPLQAMAGRFPQRFATAFLSADQANVVVRYQRDEESVK